MKHGVNQKRKIKMPLTQQELDNIKVRLYQNGLVIGKGGVIIEVSKVVKILELFLNQLKEGNSGS